MGTGLERVSEIQQKRGLSQARLDRPCETVPSLLQHPLLASPVISCPVFLGPRSCLQHVTEKDGKNSGRLVQQRFQGIPVTHARACMYEMHGARMCVRILSTYEQNK